MSTDPNKTGTDLERLVLLAICDPGAFLTRGDDYTESIPHWGMRAVLAVLAQEGKVVVDRADLIAYLNWGTGDLRGEVDARNRLLAAAGLDDDQPVSRSEVRRHTIQQQGGVP